MTETNSQRVEPEGSADEEQPFVDEAAAGPSAKKQPVTTLVGYLSGRTAATRFLKNLRDADIWSFAAADRDDAITRHRELDPRFTKTASLLAQSMKTRDERHVLPVSDFARQAFLDRLNEYPHWTGTNWGELSPVERAYKVAEVVGRRLSDAKEGRTAQNLLATSLLLLAQESLEFEVALRATARALDAHAEVTPRWNRERIQYIAGPRSKPPELRLVVQTILPWIERADAAENALTEANAATDRERQRSESAEDSARAHTKRIRELEDESEGLRRRIADLEEELRSSVVHGSHNLDRTRAGARGFLEGRLLSLLDMASEALDLDPPRQHIAQEKLEVAREAIEEQLKWLKQ